MRAFLLERVLPSSDSDEESALAELETLLDHRIARHTSAGASGKSSDFNCPSTPRS